MFILFLLLIDFFEIYNLFLFSDFVEFFWKLFLMILVFLDWIGFVCLIFLYFFLLLVLVFKFFFFCKLLIILNIDFVIFVSLWLFCWIGENWVVVGLFWLWGKIGNELKLVFVVWIFLIEDLLGIWKDWFKILVGFFGVCDIELINDWFNFLEVGLVFNGRGMDWKMVDERFIVLVCNEGLGKVVMDDMLVIFFIFDLLFMNILLIFVL